MNQTHKEHKEWYSRGYLPHFDHPGIVQMITLRLADALPANVVVNSKPTKKTLDFLIPEIYNFKTIQSLHSSKYI